MKKLKLLLIALSIILLGGCQNFLKTMVAHIPIDNYHTLQMARANATTNVCLSDNLLNRQNAYEFSVISAMMLDLVVFDNKFYKASYESTLLSELESSKRKYNVETCSALDRDLPEMTATLRTTYNNFAQRLSVARAEENRQMAESMRNYRLAGSQNYNMDFPKFSYTQEQPKTQHFLVNTSSGLSQCRVTNNSYVFCM